MTPSPIRLWLHLWRNPKFLRTICVTIRLYLYFFKSWHKLTYILVFFMGVTWYEMNSGIKFIHTRPNLENIQWKFLPSFDLWLINSSFSALTKVPFCDMHIRRTQTKTKTFSYTFLRNKTIATIYGFLFLEKSQA